MQRLEKLLQLSKIYQYIRALYYCMTLQFNCNVGQFCRAKLLYLPDISKPEIMEKITLKIRTTKTSGEIRLRFRLLDGRKADLTHKSDIKASLKDLEKFNTDGLPKPKVSVFNRELCAAITNEIELMRKAYVKIKAEHLPINGETFERTIDIIKNPITEDFLGETLLDRFKRFIDDSYKNGVFCQARHRHYKTTWRILQRFLIIHGQEDIMPENFKSEDVIRFGQFIQEEHKYTTIKKWASLYSDSTKCANIPTCPRSQNTLSTKLKMLRAFFSEIEAGEEISRNPFVKSGRKRINELISQRKNVPVFLTAEEFSKILDTTDVPDNLKETHDAFVLHCSLGCRIGDFQRLTMANASVSPDGIPYVHYLPRKTQRQAHSNEEIQTPLLKYALDIIKRTGFDFTIIRYASGKSGYNVKIKELLKHCGIDRNVPVFNEETKQNDMVPLYSVASSKLARKTFVDMMAKVQINLYASGLHSQGSDAVTHYTSMQLKDRFAMMNIAFNQPDYRVNPDLSIMENIKN